MSEAFAMNAMEAMEYEDDEGGLDGKKGGRRELSNSKRAAQNRAAQVCILYHHSLRPLPNVMHQWRLRQVLTNLRFSALSDNARKATSRSWRNKCALIQLWKHPTSIFRARTTSFARIFYSFDRDYRNLMLHFLHLRRPSQWTSIVRHERDRLHSRPGFLNHLHHDREMNTNLCQLHLCL